METFHCTALSGGVDNAVVELEIIEKITAPVFKDICLSGNVDEQCYTSGSHDV